ncbi:E3 binding domain-containing protein [Geodermatophilus poikilotrophus]|uniref:E3 binding domain-containing protein n=1 Tax=Geodermatophilus poikilotrophus TaxID=1333667 RepID=A0A1I0DLP8_9ACTN|nr:E3 binding domain-containing protein [Geodermatophilus poikilotrophus]SET33279.1 e3 binding domain-containing protein [Geodermatophilus poikilotrophus]
MTGRIARPAPTAAATRLASALGISLAGVAGSGPGCQITEDDVRAVAARRDYRAGTSHLAGVPTESRSLTTGGRLAVDPAVVSANTRVGVSDPDVRTLANTRGVFLSRVKGTGTGGAITPSDVLTAAAVQDHQRAVAHRAAFPAPKPEPAWEPPPFTASGIDPKALLDVPAPVRPAMAAAETTAAAYALRERYAGMTDDEARGALARDRAVSCDHGGIGPTRRNVWG